jgi:hypothetical protein
VSAVTPITLGDAYPTARVTAAAPHDYNAQFYTNISVKFVLASKNRSAAWLPPNVFMLVTVVWADEVR